MADNFLWRKKSSTAPQRGLTYDGEAQPSLIPDVNTTLRTIAPRGYLMKTDLTRAFYQIPLSQSSLKYCGVATAFRRIHGHTRSAMEMPGSETYLLTYPLHPSWDIRLQSHPATEPCPVLWLVLRFMRDPSLSVFSSPSSTRWSLACLSFFSGWSPSQGNFWDPFIGHPSTWPTHRNLQFLISRDIFSLPAFLYSSSLEILLGQ